MSSAGFMASFFGGGRASSAASQEAALPFPDVAPSWESLAASLEAACLAAGVEHSPDLVNGPTNPHSLQRLFGSTAPPRVHLYRDTAAWCPYCEKVWLQLEEKRIPYTVEKINMRCYGDKPASFLAICPSGMLPALELDGELYTESAAIAQLLEDKFPGHAALLPAPGTVERRAADELLRLERALFSRWMQWLTRSGDAGKPGFLEALGMVEQALQRSGGPYFLGPQLSLVDITFAPFLERMAASLLYYKAFRMRGVGAYPGLEAWFTAMHGRPTFNAIQSDVYTHAHDLPPQLGGCEFNALGPAVAAALDGHDSSSWRLPLGPLSDTSLEAWPGGGQPRKGPPGGVPAPGQEPRPGDPLRRQGLRHPGASPRQRSTQRPDRPAWGDPPAGRGRRPEAGGPRAADRPCRRWHAAAIRARRTRRRRPAQMQRRCCCRCRRIPARPRRRSAGHALPGGATVEGAPELVRRRCAACRAVRGSPSSCVVHPR